MEVINAFLQLEQLRLQIADFLNIIILDYSPYIFLNLWDIVHFFAGFLIMFLILNFKTFEKLREYKYVWIMFFLVLYELFEGIFVISSSQLFRPETKTDILWDIIIGMVGAFSFEVFKNKFLSKKFKKK